MRVLSAFAFAAFPVLALAETAPAPAVTEAVAPGSPFASMMPLVFIFGIFYFFLIRPQQKRMKEHQALLADLKKGDEVVTAGGIVGKITRVEATGDTLVVEIAKGVEVSVIRSTVSNVLGKTQAPSAKTEKKKPSAKANKNDNTPVSRDSIANDN